MNNFKLIDGVYTPSEAKEILNALLYDKINFYKVRAFSHEIRFSEVDSHAEKRIAELQQTKADLQQLLAAQANNGKLIIKSTITIEQAQ